MKVALFDHSVSGHHIEYARYLSKFLLNNGDEVLFITSQLNDRVNGLTDLGVEVYLSYDILEQDGHISTLINRSRFLHQAFAKASQWNADVMHHLFFDESEVAHLINILSSYTISAPLLVTLFNPRYTKKSNSMPANLFRKINKNLVRYLFNGRIIDGMFVHSQFIKTTLEKELGIPKEKIYSIPDPIEPFDQPLSKNDARKQIGLADLNETMFLFFGGLRYDKGIDILLKLIAERDRNDEAFVLAGAPAYITEEDVKNTQERLDNPRRIVPRLEFIPDQSVPLYFFAADAIVLPYRSEYTGTSGILQRAISAKKPVIATNVGEVGNIVSNWEVGVVVQPDSVESLNDGIEEYLANKDSYAIQARESAESYIEQHHWRTFANKVRQTYQSVLASSN